MPYTQKFRELKKNVKKTYLGKEVPPKWQSKYGKRYDPDEIKSISFAIAKKKGMKIDK